MLASGTDLMGGNNNMVKAVGRKNIQSPASENKNKPEK